MKFDFRILVITASLFMSGFVFAQDVLFSTSLEDARLSKMYALLRKTWIAQTGEDPLNQQFDDVIEFDLSEAVRELSGDSRVWVRDFQQLMNMDFLSSKIFLKINKPKFTLKDQFSSITPFYDNDKILHWKGKHFLKGVMLSAESISLISKIPRLNQQTPIELDIELLSPQINMVEQVSSAIQTQWLTKLEPENFVIQTESLGVLDTIREIQEHPHLIGMTFEKLNIPQVEIEIGRRRVRFDQQKIERFTRDRLDDLKLLVLELVMNRYERYLDNVLINKKPFIEFPRDQFFSNEQLSIGSRLVSIESPREKELFVGFNVSLCSDSSIIDVKTCIKDRNYSMGTVDQIVELSRLPNTKKAFDLHVQIKEKLINELLATTVKANMWQEILDEEKLTWGTYGAFLHTKKASDTFDLYLDFYHHLNKKDAFLVGRKKIHFAVKLRVALLIERASATSFKLKLIVKELFNDDRSLLDGYPELNLVSDVGTVPRFKRKLLDRLQTKLLKFKDRTLVDVELPEISNSLINQVTFTSDDQGTLHGFFDLQ